MVITANRWDLFGAGLLTHSLTHSKEFNAEIVMSLWEYCALDTGVLHRLDSVETSFDQELEKIGVNDVAHGFGSTNNIDVKENGVIAELLNCLVSSDEEITSFVNELDGIIAILDVVSSQHSDVTSRTNNLMLNCESLLEQQRSIQATAESLRITLTPFDDIEDIANILGIPIDGKSGNKIKDGTTDPRSPEFQAALVRLSKALSFLNDHNDFLDSDRYQKWLLQLQNRATSLIAQSMKELLDNAYKACVDVIAKQFKANNKGEEQPLEAAPIYQKFRGLGFRMRELSALLYISSSSSTKRNKSRSISHDNVSSDDVNESDILHTASDILKDVKNSYVEIRIQLLMPYIRQIVSHIDSSSDKTSTSNNDSLSPGIRQAYALLLRISQLEFQLAETLFNAVDNNVKYRQGQLLPTDVYSNSSSNLITPLANMQCKTSKSDYSEIKLVVQNVSNAINDKLRPLIIREVDIDELCRVITTLAEDVKTQITAMTIPKILTTQLLTGLELIVSDTQERLVYCAELKLRQEIQMFEPTSDNLAYPDILERFHSEYDAGTTKPIDITKTWYPPLHRTLSLLSKLYGVVDMSVFENYARRSVEMCVKSLKIGSDKIKRINNNSVIHGDLFLVRHLLVLREQLIPFEIRLQGTDRILDYKPTVSALQHLASHTRSLFRFDIANGLLLFAWDGIPALQEMQVDAKKELDNVLKNACISLKQNTIKLVLSALDGFLSKVVAFTGDIPINNENNRMLAADNASTPLLSSEATNTLKSQAFMRPERIKEMLDTMSSSCVSSIVIIKNLLVLYIDNNIARTILLKPVQLEIATMKKKIDCIISSCLENGPERVEIEVAIANIVDTITKELAQIS